MKTLTTVRTTDGVHPRFRCGLVLVTTALLATTACGGSPPLADAPLAETAKPPVLPPLARGPVQSYVPAAGLRWMVVARLREASETPWLATRLAALFPERRLDAYRAATGLDLRSVSEGLVAGYDFGTLYLARTADSQSKVVSRFESRTVAGAIVHQSHPDVRVFTGTVGDTPAALVSQPGHLIGVAFGDPRLARIVEAYAQKRLDSPPALRGAALSVLPNGIHHAPLRFYVPGPFEGEWRLGAGGLLAAATALAVVVWPIEPDAVRVVVVVAGEWSDTGGRARARAEGVWSELAASALGRLTALDHPRHDPIVIVTPDQIQVTVDLALEPLVNGLHAAVAADLWELLDMPPPGGEPQEGRTTE